MGTSVGFNVFVIVLGTLALGVVVLSAVASVGTRSGPSGLALRRQVSRAAGVRALRRKSAVLRPSLTAAAAGDLGYCLGRSAGVDCWVSVEDSIVVLGPP